MAKLIHSMVSTLPWRHLVQIICMTVAAIAAAVAARNAEQLEGGEEQQQGRDQITVSWRQIMASTSAPFYQKNRSQQDKMQGAAQRVTRKQSFSECLPAQQVIPVQSECGGVDAIAQPGRFRAVLEQVAEMRIAPAAARLDTGHAVAVIRQQFQRLLSP